MSIVASQESVLQIDARSSFFRFIMELDYDMRKTTAAKLCLRKKEKQAVPRTNFTSIYQMFQEH